MIALSSFAVAQLVPTPPEWGGLITNNNGDSELFKDQPAQLPMCQAVDQFERLNATWAQITDLHACYVMNPQPNKSMCDWHCDYGVAGLTIWYYCGTWEDKSSFGPTPDPNTGQDICIAPSEKNPGKPCCGAGNPISVGYGNKYQEEIDYTGTGNFPLRFARSYNSKGGVGPGLVGARWLSTYDRSLSQKLAPAIVSIYAYRPDGKSFYFTLMKNGVVVPLTPYDSAATWQVDADVTDRLTRVVDGSGNTLGWTYYVGATEDTESYDATGRLTSIVNRAGLAQTVVYDGAGHLVSVTDSFGRALTVGYDSQGRIASMTDPAGSVYSYAYDATGNLSSVTNPDLSVRTYLYNESAYTSSANLPNALTGILDELGNRFATFTYNAQGTAIATEHAGGLDKYSIAYGGSTVVTDPLGTSRTYTFSTILGAIKSTGISQPCSTCGSSNFSSVAYDGNGNVSSRTDFNSKKVCYSYDLTRNLETARLEGALSTETCSTVLASPPNRPDVRKITTTWNATYRLPATITEPAPGGTKTTTFTYDASGNLTQKSIAAPANDGSNNTLTRTWSWTYSTYGRVLTATDPDNHTTTTAYYADTDADLGKRGNALTITNAAGHVTQFTSYDFNARPLTLVDPNGLTTTLAYDTRGRITSRQVGTETTSYTYDGVGQLTKVTQPDGSYLQYTYDAAHRLTQINDGLSNKLVYTLDAAGNRIAEDAFDPTNALARVRQQVYDSLNRLHQAVGAQ